MNTIYDSHVRDGIITRIYSLDPGATPVWGKMTAYQMLKHCRLWEEMSLGRITYKRVFVGRIFGRMALSSLLSGDKPLRRNTPSIPELIIQGDGDITQEKAAWTACLRSYGDRPGAGIVHPFFGRMTGEEVGRLAYKHADHHLRQFNG